MFLSGISLVSRGALASFLGLLTLSSDSPFAATTDEDDDFVERWLRGDDFDDLADLGLDALAGQQAAALDQLLPPLSIWDVETVVSGGIGYRDNVTLSPRDARSGRFLLAGLETSVLHLGEAVHFSLLFEVEHLEFPADRNLPDDTLATLFSQLRVAAADDVTATLNVRALYLDQVIDVETLHEFDQPAIAVRSHGAGASPALRRTLPSNFFAEGSASVLRQKFRAPLFDFWEYGPAVAAGWSPGKSELAFKLEHLWRDYDDRPARSVDGEPLGERDVEFRILRPEISYRHAWGDGRWQSQTRIGLEFTRDNATDYFAYDRTRLFQRLNYRSGRWTIEGFLRYSLVDYKTQVVDEDGALRERRLLGTGFEVRCELAECLEAFFRYDREAARSNERHADYSVNTWRGGLGWKF